LAALRFWIASVVGLFLPLIGELASVRSSRRYRRRERELTLNFPSTGDGPFLSNFLFSSSHCWPLEIHSPLSLLRVSATVISCPILPISSLVKSFPPFFYLAYPVLERSGPSPFLQVAGMEYSEASFFLAGSCTPPIVSAPSPGGDSSLRV